MNRWGEGGMEVWGRRIMVFTGEEFFAGGAEGTERFRQRDEPSLDTVVAVGVDQMLARGKELGVGWNKELV
jgi:hypothetical protein